MGELTTDSTWCVDIPGLIGLGNCSSQTVFESVQVREVTGRGRLRSTLSTPIDPAFLKTVAALPAAEQIRRVSEKLKELNPGFDAATVKTRIELGSVTEFACLTRRVVDAWPIRAFPALRKLDVGDDKVPGALADIGFLKGMKLQELGLANTRVIDLAPLQGMPLQRLQVSGTPLKDLSPLRGSKLASLSISNTTVTDLAPLKDLPLQRIELDRNMAGDGSGLKAIKSLKTVNDLPAADFVKGLRESWAPLFDGKTTDCLRNPTGWRVERGALVSDGSGLNSAQSKYEFENGDLRIRFEGKGWDSLSFRVRQSDRGAAGLFFDGVGVRSLEGRPHELIFACRGETVTATLDGKPAPLTDAQAVKSGCIQFNAANGQLRVLAIEYRAAP